MVLPRAASANGNNILTCAGWPTASTHESRGSPPRSQDRTLEVTATDAHLENEVELRSPGHLVDPAIAAHRGRVIKRTGDGPIIELRSVATA